MQLRDIMMQGTAKLIIFKLGHNETILLLLKMKIKEFSIIIACLKLYRVIKLSEEIVWVHLFLLLKTKLERDSKETNPT